MAYMLCRLQVVLLSEEVEEIKMPKPKCGISGTRGGQDKAVDVTTQMTIIYYSCESKQPKNPAAERLLGH